MTLARSVRNLRSLDRRFRQARMLGRAIKSSHHPILAHIIPIRRCNLSCAYCNEYDKVSSPVPIAEMLRRVDLLAALGTGIITFSGGEPLLHPELDEIIRRIRSHGIIATLITNGYLLTPERIQQLNRAGLEHLQISIDNVQPDDVSKKSLKVLDKKLQWLAEHAWFDVNINSVLGAGVRNPADALTITRRALELGFDTTVGIIHDHSGQLRPLEGEERSVYQQIQSERKPAFWAFAYDNLFHKNLALGQSNEWQCRAGSRYLYICEDGLVHYCSQQRGYPAIPLEKYTSEDLEREYWTRKPCAPYCTISCVHRVAMIDLVREKPRQALARFFPPGQAGTPAKLPLGIRFLSSIFLTPENGRPQNPAAKAMAGAVMRVLGIK
ncbi:radical SAM protein [Alloacidobacterium dinghuense]|uniref:Radical SAM protein n=1 Tax=Alloacidobacterium dinghuense TaxID=2763107 RepID=A0A7G8BDH0_9BACT|nr:radical SAM protein [Alloacidobacterium dinghuense]QNI30590.1 radical SAM protein [Alloacidobacterium dinghuense]